MNPSIFDKYLSIELKADAIDKNLCNIQIIEMIEEYGKYRYEQKRIKIEKNKLEKIAQEIIKIL